MPNRGLQENIYADFNLTVMVFDSVDSAQHFVNKIEMIGKTSGYSDGECIYRKNPWIVIADGRYVYYMEARAEMLRGVIERYTDFIAQINDQNNQRIILNQPIELALALRQLFDQLKVDHFVIKPSEKDEKSIGFYNCTTRGVYEFSGSGIQHYYIRRSKPISSPIGKVYPDFHLTVMSFETVSDAHKYADMIRSIGRNFGREGSRCLYNKGP